MVILEYFIKEIIIRNNWIINFSICYVIMACDTTNKSSKIGKLQMSIIDRLHNDREPHNYLFIYFLYTAEIYTRFFRIIFDLGAESRKFFFECTIVSFGRPTSNISDRYTFIILFEFVCVKSSPSPNTRFTSRVNKNLWTAWSRVQIPIRL